ncbi:MAG: M1 family metallopeptidase [Anaerolineae bacterium]|nr:M1 family metallopeptidase [Anaerolineae bacterium]
MSGNWTSGKWKATLLLIAAVLLGSCTPPAELAPAPMATAASGLPPSPSATPSPTAAPQPTGVATWPEQEAALLPAACGDLALLDDPTYYRLELTLDPAGLRLHGHADILYTNNEEVPLHELYVRLFPNRDTAHGGGMEVEHIAVAGRSAVPQFELQRTAMRLPLAPPLAPDESLELSMDFTVSVPPGAGGNYGAFAAQQGVIALAHFYPFIPVYDDEGWNVELAPSFGDIIYADISLYDVTFTAPVEMVVVATGTALPLVAHADGTATWHFVSGPARDFNLVLSRQYEVLRRQVDGISVNSYYLPGDTEGGEAVLDIAAEALRIFSRRFGSYPYRELDVVATYTSAAGIEYPGLVVIAKRLYEGSERMEWVVAHEVAHQWWYNLVGNDQVDEPWLDEALTQYTASLYYEDRYGQAVAEEARRVNFWDRWEQAREEGRDRPVAGPVASFAPEDYGAIVYSKGPLFFHRLRELVGDRLFEDILRAYFQKHRYGIATAESFLAVAERVSGRNLDALYRQWILGF